VSRPEHQSHSPADHELPDQLFPLQEFPDQGLPLQATCSATIEEEPSRTITEMVGPEKLGTEAVCAVALSRERARMLAIRKVIGWLFLESFQPMPYAIFNVAPCC
jgi:hypothetical protein